MVARQLAAFIEGAIGGAELRQGWQDRVRRQKDEDEETEWQRKERKRQEAEWEQADEDRKLEIEDRKRERGYESEDRAWTRESRGIVRAEAARKRELIDAEDELFDDVLKDIRRDAEGDSGAKYPVPKVDGEPAAKGKKKAKPSTGHGRSIAPPAIVAPEPAPAPAVPPPAAPPAVTPPGGAMADPGLVMRVQPLGAATEAAADTRPTIELPYPEAVPADAPMRAVAAPDTAAAAGASAAAALPSVKIAAQTSPRAVALPEGSDTPEVRNDHFMARYRREAVPKIRDFYLQRGDVEKAEAWEKWATDGDVKEGMAAWAKGVHAASAGDEDGFMESMVDAYNAGGYFEDGYQAVRKKSGFTKDADGTITGAKITLRNQRTGEETVQEFDGIDDVYRFGVNFMSPEKVFEYGQAQIAAAAASAEADLKHRQALELAEVRYGKTSTSLKRIQETMEMLAESDIMFGRLSAEEQVDRAVQVIEEMEAAAQGMDEPGLTVWRGE